MLMYAEPIMLFITKRIKFQIYLETIIQQEFV